MSETSDRNRAIRQAAWVDRALHGGRSDSVTPLGLTPEELYRAAGWRELTPPEVKSPEAARPAMKAYWGENFSLKPDRDQVIAQHTDQAMLAILREPELQHIFTGTAQDFDTIHELQRQVSSAINDSYRDGYEARFFETEEE